MDPDNGQYFTPDHDDNVDAFGNDKHVIGKVHQSMVNPNPPDVNFALTAKPVGMKAGDKDSVNSIFDSKEAKKRVNDQMDLERRVKAMEMQDKFDMLKGPETKATRDKLRAAMEEARAQPPAFVSVNLPSKLKSLFKRVILINIQF